ncbi:MAG: DNA primase [Candidatus Eisenbacteria bacterium]
MSGRLDSARNPRGQDDWVERVRAASDIVEVIGQSVSLRRTGRNWVGLCPFHNEKTPSFSVNPERQFYYCFSCKAGGDIFKFVQETERVDFLEAAELLSQRAGIAVPERGVPGERGARARLHEALEAAAQAYESWLGDPAQGASARAYLERRGLTIESRRRFRLGLAPAGWEALVQRLRARHGEDTLVTAGLAARRDQGKTGLYDRFRNRLIIPLTASGGQVVGFGARALADEDNPKYLNSPETPVYHKGAFLYGLDLARREVSADGELIVVEGYFDAIALHHAGLANTVATSGTALTPEQAAMLRRVVARVVLTYDGDAAGQEAMMRSLGVLLAEGLDVAIVDLPPGEDPDTLVRREGIAGWNALRERAADPVDFVHRHLLRRAAERSGPGADPRERALQAVAELGARIPDPIRRDLLFERAEQTLGLSRAVLHRSVERRPQVPGGASGAAIATRLARGPVRDGAESHLLRALLHAPQALEPAREQIAPADFRDPDCAALARILWASGGSAGDDPAPVLTGDGAEAALARELASDERVLDWMEEARGAVRVMVQRRLREELRDRQQRLRGAVAPEESARLMEDIGQIARSLRDWGVTGY